MEEGYSSEREGTEVIDYTPVCFSAVHQANSFSKYVSKLTLKRCLNEETRVSPRSI